ncbi:hypothetical protein ACPUEN_16750 [Algoriphagus yeomjeoni]|uniref:Spy/CpxP family protein refolding chaperone n=1 Tax=Algoriphagus yeomjeoni TaxID=291403 RepID=UPI003CE5C55A
MKNILILYLILHAGFVNAQDLFQKNIYSADRVMELRKELELTDAQATTIKKIHSENAGKFSSMKWDLDDATLKLKELLDQTKIDEVAIQKQMDKVLALENSLKKQQLSTMVSIKNELNLEQQEILQGQRVQTVNGVNIVGYGVNSVSSTNPKTRFTPNYRVGKPLYGSVSSSSNPSPQIVLKAVGSSQKNAPLYMLDTKDGMKEFTDFKNINPNDIESINVLKDKAAIDTFGEKGKNGVIVIKLKEDPKK